MDQDNNRHRDAMEAVINAARLLYLWVPDLKDVIRDGQRALDVGCLLCPSEWIAKHKHLEEDLDLLRRALPLVQYAAEAMKRDEKVEPAEV